MMKTKIIFMLVAIFAMYSQSAFSQERKRPDREKIQAMQCNQVVTCFLFQELLAI